MESSDSDYRTFTASAPNLFQSSTGQADQVTFQVDEGTPLYYNYLLQANLFNEYWDDQAKVPYALGKNGLNTFLSFDNERSIAEKAKYIIDHDLGGVIIWEITGDYIETAPGSGVIASAPLADTLNSVLCNYAGGSSAALIEEKMNPKIYPNPSNGYIQLLDFNNQMVLIAIRNLNGELVISPRYFSNNELIQIDLPTGIYLMEVTDDSGHIQMVKMILQ